MQTDTGLSILERLPHLKTKPLVMCLVSIAAALAVALALVPNEKTLLVGLVVAIPLLVVIALLETRKTEETKWPRRVLSWFSLILFMFTATAAVLSLLGILPGQTKPPEPPRFPDVPKIQVLESRRTLDLRGHQQVAANQREQKVSRATWKYEQTIIRADASETVHVHRFSTSGLEPDVRCLSHPVYSLTNVTGPGRFNGPRMRHELDLAIDISKDPVGEEIQVRFEADYWNAFQGVTTDWAAARAFYPEQMLVFVVIFPDNKPFKQYRLSAYPNADGARYEAFPDPDVTASEDGTRIEWRIAKPRLNCCYRIDWDW